MSKKSSGSSRSMISARQFRTRSSRPLAAAGWPVTLTLLGSRETLTGEAAHAARLWKGAIAPFSVGSLDGAGVVIDALFGAGLSPGRNGTSACRGAQDGEDTH